MSVYKNMESRTTILQWTLSALSNFWNIAQCWDLSQKNNKKHMEILDRSQIWIWWRELSTSWRSSVCLLTRFNLSDLILNLNNPDSDAPPSNTPSQSFTSVLQTWHYFWIQLLFSDQILPTPQTREAFALADPFMHADLNYGRWKPDICWTAGRLQE